MKQTEFLDRTVEAIGQNFRTFGGGRVDDPNNPICHALKNHLMQFAAGVDVRAVVLFVIRMLEELER